MYRYGSVHRSLHVINVINVIKFHPPEECPNETLVRLCISSSCDSLVGNEEGYQTRGYVFDSHVFILLINRKKGILASILSLIPMMY